MRRRAENLREGDTGARDLRPHGGRGQARQTVVPIDVIVAVHADFMSTADECAQGVGKRARRLRARQQRAVEDGAPAVGPNSVGAQHLG